MSNLTYKTGSKLFVDTENNVTIELAYTHGGTEAQIGGGYSEQKTIEHLPTTWVHLSLRRPENVTHQDFCDSIFEAGTYQQKKSDVANIDSIIDQHGIPLISSNSLSAEFGRGFHKDRIGADDVREHLNEKGMTVSDQTIESIREFETEMTQEALESAALAFKRTGGKSNNEITR